jgi:hypothetical protein
MIQEYSQGVLRWVQDTRVSRGPFRRAEGKATPKATQTLGIFLEGALSAEVGPKVTEPP